MNDTQITVQGFVGGMPALKKVGEVEVATFRLGCTPRYFNRRTQLWVDAPTQWYTVNAWRGMARNVAESLRKGDGVTVVGRLNVATWRGQDGSDRTTLEIEATSVGHDLRHGTTRFSRTERPAREEVAPAAGPVPDLADEPAPEAPDAMGDWRADPSAA